MLPGPETIRHGRVELALHALSDGEGPVLLLLHALHGSSADWEDAAATWPGPVHALDFSGHGASDWLPGRGYSPEVFVAEADCALAHLSHGEPPLYLAGAGVGAYVALLVSGARPRVVRGCLLLPGAGLAGGGAHPDDLDGSGRADWAATLSAPARRDGAPGPDPLVSRCERDVRPLYYAEEFARAARRLHVAPVSDPPPWLGTAITCGDARPAPADLGDALRQLAAE